MANALYDKARESFLKGEISWSGDNVKVVLLDLADYAPDLANDQYLSDIPAGARAATSGNLSGKTTSAGVADADNVTFATVTGDPSEGFRRRGRSRG
ncbi:MAG: hypothetical protein KIS66_11835 [Fimbriimonadaceae bacterium]|nr:hypothetical protein [Fimbriimonadaceae bacterium]